MEPIPESSLDTLLRRLYQLRETALELRPNVPAEFWTRHGKVFGEPIAAERLTGMLAAVTPAPTWTALQEAGRAEFNLDAREGLFHVSLRAADDGIHASVTDATRNRGWPSGAPMPSSRFPSVVNCLACGGLAFLGFAVLLTLVPFQRYGHPSKRSRSLNNVKQLTLAVMQYAQDYDETFPGWVDGASLTPARAGMYHNTWDEQINGQIKSKDVFTNGNTGIKSPSDPEKERVLTYAMNGALIAPYDGRTGDVNWTAAPVSTGDRATLLGPGMLANPAETILFAEVATDSAPPTAPAGAAGARPDAANATTRPSEAWLKAQPRGDSAAMAVIDISPRAWISQGMNTTDAWYNEQGADYGEFTRNGVARNLRSGGGCYGFVDGHVKFMKIAATVGIGQSNGKMPVTARNWFKASNVWNMWNPDRHTPEGTRAVGHE